MLVGRLSNGYCDNNGNKARASYVVLLRHAQTRTDTRSSCTQHTALHAVGLMCATKTAAAHQHRHKQVCFLCSYVLHKHANSQHSRGRRADLHYNQAIILEIIYNYTEKHGILPHDNACSFNLELLCYSASMSLYSAICAGQLKSNDNTCSRNLELLCYNARTSFDSAL